MSNIITDSKSARALVKYERDRSKVVYSEYIAANAVTLDTVSEHVAALAEMAYPGVDPRTAPEDVKAERKGFMNRVRNGLNYRLGKAEADRAAREASTGQEDAGEAAESDEGATVTVTPVGAFLAAVEAFHAAGYSLSDARAVIADVYGSADSVDAVAA